MKEFEIFYLIVEPFFPALYDQVRIRLKNLTKNSKTRLKILDVGGRKSHYTIGIPADFIISDLPKESDLQKKLNLGINESIIDKTKSRRSNIKDIVFDNMVNSQLPDNEFDGVIAIEVIEHIEQDDKFLQQISRILKPGGFLLLTTPNGDHIINTNPDHKRHYKKEQLAEKLKQAFKIEELCYIVSETKEYRYGLNPWNYKKPIKTMKIMFSNLQNRKQSRSDDNPDTTCHLLSIVKKTS
jgi:SAM-dependent methyltransferase